MSSMKIVESIASTWVFHLSVDPNGVSALCGAQTMPSPALLESWGDVSHIRERYCARCGALAGFPGVKHEAADPTAGRELR
ncbi:hypothetical protein NFA_40060 [Nocardia farcinica IFM 10152]|uniref:Uncharacterized protein n=1 Tax=Nocardia farcinica (strain IFM 10152) TaxID=247156 RepID=Q5YSI7_NOCFA|nr:hypothetical protein NFA_40060 [Nocardia farcinica IFM 10152]